MCTVKSRFRKVLSTLAACFLAAMVIAGTAAFYMLPEQQRQPIAAAGIFGMLMILKKMDASAAIDLPEGFFIG